MFLTQLRKIWYVKSAILRAFKDDRFEQNSIINKSWKNCFLAWKITYANKIKNFLKIYYFSDNLTKMKYAQFRCFISSYICSNCVCIILQRDIILYFQKFSINWNVVSSTRHIRGIWHALLSPISYIALHASWYRCKLPSLMLPIVSRSCHY